MNYNFHFKFFSELSTTELYCLLQLREEVFVIEQNCIYKDIDTIDINCFHLLMTKGSELIGYCRIIEPGTKFINSSIGRVIIKQTYRGRKLGLPLMKEAIMQCKKKWPNSGISISAQAHLTSFYSSLGFEVKGEIYDEDGIPHIKMEIE